MHGAVFLDAADAVLRPAILWNDQRTQAECDWITGAIGREKVVELTSNPVLTGFTAPKIVWLRNNEPETYAKVRKVLLPKDYIRLKLTGEYATEVSDASGTSLFNVTKRQWADEMLDGCGIPRDWMPRSYESAEVSGRISREAAALTGLAEGTPVVGGGGDQAAGAVGNGIVETGIVSSTVGTSGVVFAFSDTPTVDPGLRLHTFCHAVPGTWHAMGVMLAAAGSLRWLRNVVGAEESTLVGEAAAWEPGAEGLHFLPYLTGERTPHNDPDARASFTGLTSRHDRGALARAVLEGVAYGLRDSLELLKELGFAASVGRISGGGARSELWTEIVATVLGIPLERTAVDEGAAYGAALLAGVRSGRFADAHEAVAECVRVTARVEPNASWTSAYDEGYERFRALYPALRSLT
jgi:xylulokinase